MGSLHHLLKAGCRKVAGGTDRGCALPAARVNSAVLPYIMGAGLSRKIFHRRPDRILSAVLHFHRVLGTFWGLRLFRHPFALLRCYYLRTSPEGLCVETRSGRRIFLTGDQDDLVTILIVIGRKDYGPIPKGGVVIDVGAHLGAFTLYALEQGARKVYSYEPDPRLYRALVRNVGENGLTEHVEAHEAAVIGSGAREVVFHPEGNASGHVGHSGDDEIGIIVSAQTLAAVFADHQISHVDLLKLDCEGSEYGILFETPDSIWERIRAVRLEFHEGRVGEIERRMRNLGFRTTRRIAGAQQTGMLWFERELASPESASAALPG
jgi:FkbM family methyltransferase